MADAKTAFLAGFVAAAGLAAAGWFLRVVPAQEETQGRLADAEETARRAGREAADSRNWAETERERNRTLEDRVKELQRALDAASTAAARAASERAADGGGHGGHGGTMDPQEPPPEEWDRERLNQEIENLAARSPEVLSKYARLPLVIRALRKRGEDGAQMVLQMLQAGLPAPFDAVEAVLAEGLGDARAVPFLLEKWKTVSDPPTRRLVLRALANLPGDQAVPALKAAWSDPGADAQIHVLAIQGLALRGDPVAREAAAGTGDATQTQRARAVEWLRTCAERGGWKDATLVPVFGRALRTADGPAQRKLSLIALEGFWSKDALADLDAFAADAASPPELAARAKRAADGIRNGEPRPERAGVPDRDLVSDIDR